MSASTLPPMPGPWSKLGQRSSSALAGSVVAALLVALWESRRLESAFFWGLLSNFGLVIIPLAVISVGAAILSVLLQPGEVRGLRSSLSSLNRRADAQRLSALMLLGAVLAPLLLVAASQATLFGFASNHDAATRGAAASAALTALLVALAAVLSALSRRLAPRMPVGFTPTRSLGLSGALAVLLILSLIFVGDTSGGRSAFELLGVLGRDELDLNLPAYVVLTLLIGLQFIVWMRRSAWVYGVALAACASAALAFPAVALDDPQLLTSTERTTALARKSLHVLQRFGDADGDGFASTFGGGDCNDRDATVYPGAEDVPGDGRDQDCSGHDALPIKEPVVEPVPVPPEPAAQLGDDSNVLLITVDTLRWDLGFMGYERPITPNLDRLAKRSTVFEHAYSLASYTGKSIGPMFIGRYPSETHRGWMHFNKYPKEDVMVQERLRQAGIRTISVQAHWYFKEDTGLGRGFDVLDMSAAPRVPQGEGDRSVNSGELTDAALRLLAEEAKTDQRFFMWVHYLDPHSDYVPHEKFDFGKSPRDLYDGEIAFTDHHIGRLLEFVEQTPLDKNTAIIFTSDHGEAFGEHGMIRHGFELWEEIVRVPLLVHIPGFESGRVEERRSAIDLVPTLLELFGVEADGDFLRGTSLVRDVRNPDAAASRPVLMDMPPGPYNGERQAFIAEDMKITTSNTRTMGVYDLAQDPGETKNLMGDAKIAQPLHEKYLEFRRGLDRVQVKPR